MLAVREWKPVNEFLGNGPGLSLSTSVYVSFMFIVISAFVTRPGPVPPPVTGSLMNILLTWINV